jgi:hypothetical protein
MDETRLTEKLARIEALFAGATTDGEKNAAAAARQRILERLRVIETTDPPIEYRFTMADRWARKLFVALLRRYELPPYRYRGQRHTTVMAKVSKSFVDQTLWPEFQQLVETLEAHLDEVTDGVVSRLHSDTSDATIKISGELAPGTAGR